MKIKYIIPFLVLVVVFSFGLSSCGGDNNKAKIFELENKIVDKNIEIEGLKSDLTEIENQLKVANKQIEEMENANIETVAEETPEEETIPFEEAVREIIKKYIESELKGKLVKFAIDEEKDNINISYNSRWSSEDTIKREMFEVVSLIAGTDLSSSYNLDLTATASHSGDSYKSSNLIEVLMKLNNYEMDYSEWLETTF